MDANVDDMDVGMGVGVDGDGGRCAGTGIDGHLAASLPAKPEEVTDGPGQA